MADSNPSGNAQVSSNGSNLASSYNPAAGYLNAEARRTLSSPTFQTGPFAVQVPRDTVLKRMYIKLIASFSVTYASGSPIFAYEGVMDRLCSTIELNVNGNRIVKSVRPHLARLHNLILGGVPRRAYNFGASAPTVSRASNEWIGGTVAYPATTQFALINEGFELSFENPWGYGGSRSVSELDIRDAASCDLKFYWNAIGNVQGDLASPATVTYGSQSIVVNPQIIENRGKVRPEAGQTMFDYVETGFSRTFTGQAIANQIQLQTGNFFMGLGMFCQNGDGGLTPSDNLLTNIQLLINGASAIQGPVSFQDLQDDNVSRYGCVDWLGIADIASTIASNANQHALRGFAMMNLIKNGNWNTAINTSRAAGVDSLVLQFGTPASTGTDAGTYTNPLALSLHTHEIRPYVYTR